MNNPSSFTLNCSRKGVHLFEMGRLGEAKNCFREAFRAVSMATRSATKLSFKKENRLSSLNLYSELDSFPIIGWSNPILNQSAASDKDDNPIFVYSRAIHLHEKPSSSHHDARFYADIYSICVSYNLGLSYHVMAICSAKSQSWGYRQACALYEQAMTTLEDLLVVGSAQEENALPYLHELEVVILNNAGHIYYTDRVNFGAAVQCFVAVCSVVSNKEKPAGSLSKLSDPEIDMMVSNVLMRYSMTAPMA